MSLYICVLNFDEKDLLKYLISIYYIFILDKKMLKICLVLLLIQLGLITASEVSLDILMPHVIPKQVGWYLVYYLFFDRFIICFIFNSIERFVFVSQIQIKWRKANLYK